MSEPTRRAGALGVHSLDHFSLAVPDISLAEKFYGAFGLELQNTSAGFGLHKAGHSQRWGVARHVIGSNYFFYVRDPWGSYSEYSADIDYIPADVNWPSGDHPPEDAIYLWGPKMPEDFIVNYEVKAV
jgi:catechol 2,3-dioxygenase-like lactoylglutathione lyase family enzyme